MSKHKIRKDKTCQNCGSFVEKNFCPNCGQENSNSRQSFHHLFTHFVSDYLHYDSSFWKSIKCMLFYPGRISLEYMKGKRKSYVNPFSLYIFISFVAFFLPPLLPEAPEEIEEITHEEKEIIEKKKEEEANALIKKEIDLANELHGTNITVHEEDSVIDSIEVGIPDDVKKISKDNFFYRTFKNIEKNASDERKQEKMLEFIVNNIPKVLFVYMPLFAFFLWLFHNKKKFYYFDSGIFTLHFLSVVLLTFTIGSIILCIAEWLDWFWLEFFTWTFSALYITFYFFRGNRIFYAEKRWVANIKSFILVILNFFLILFVFILYALFAIYITLG